ncbi:MAG: hypothetical protein HY811_09375 [Planctomycetes bacterium]|nr:hypothetical protein [Planctomycetota bacterium]
MMTTVINQNIKEALRLARELVILADKGEAASKDDGCRVLYSIIRDCAYSIRVHVEREREEHRKKGLWLISDGPDNNGEDNSNKN